MANQFLRKYGAAATIDLELYQPDGIDLEVAATFVAGDLKIMKDEAPEANTTNLLTDEGQGYSLVLTATEMQAARIVVYIVDQTATKVWLDKVIVVETYGNALAQHAIDLDDSVRAGLTALPNFAADAAGGLPISIAGGLNLDSKLANTNEITVARMGALTDWINAGRLDAILDLIAADVVNIDGAAMRGTDSALLAASAPTNFGSLVITAGGAVDSLVQGYLNTLILESTAGRIAANFDNFYDNGDLLTTRIVDNVHPATDVVSGGAITTSGGSVSNVTLVATTTVNTDMRGTDSALLAASAPTNFGSLVITAGGAVDSLLQGYLNTLIVETTAGRIAANFDNFYDNADGVTTSIVDQVNQIASDLPVKITKNVALNNFPFLMIDDTDHITGKTGLTFAAANSQRSIDGAAFANTTNVPTEVANGAYKVNLSAGDLNGDTIILKFTGTAADDRFITIIPQAT